MIIVASCWHIAGTACALAGDERGYRYLCGYAAQAIRAAERRAGPLRDHEDIIQQICLEWLEKAGPPDEAGHGGGFVFDCRSLPNPGRHEEFASVTGRDAPVAEFLDAAPEVEAFWSHVIPLVDAHIRDFQERNFADLSVAFGCTGGQHRSVYFVERLARYIRQRHPGVAVDVQHGEQDRWPGAGPAPAASEPPMTPGLLARPARLSDGSKPWMR